MGNMDHEYWREQMSIASNELLDVMLTLLLETIGATPEQNRIGLGIPISNLVNEYKKRGLKLPEQAAKKLAPILRQALNEAEKNLQGFKDALQETTKEMN